MVPSVSSEGRASQSGVVILYRELAEGTREWEEVAAQEWNRLANTSEELEEDASRVLAKLVWVAKRGLKEAKTDSYGRDHEDGEWIYLFSCGGVAMLYAVEAIDGRNEVKTVTALRFCRSASPGVRDEDFQVARDRLKRWRKRA